MALPRPINFGMWALAVGLAYGTLAKNPNEQWDGWDFAMVVALTWVARKGVREFL